MAQDFSRSFYRSKLWQDTRRAYIASVFNLCERCRKPGYILHHRIPLTPDNINDPEITLGFKNLKYVCKDCHEIEHGNVAEVTRPGLMFDDSGQIVKV